MKFREPKSNDQDRIQKAFDLLLDLIELHQHQIEPALWIGAMVGAMANNYEKSHIPFEYFEHEMYEAIKHYKY